MLGASTKGPIYFSVKVTATSMLAPFFKRLQGLMLLYHDGWLSVSLYHAMCLSNAVKGLQ